MVGMVQAAEDGPRPDRASARPIFIECWLGQGLPEALVRPRPNVVGDVLAQHAGEVALPEDQHVVQAFAAHAAQAALAHGMRRTAIPLAAATDANAAPYLPSLSRIRYFGW